MEKLIQEQREVLAELCERLNKRFVAARLSEDGAVLTVLLPQIRKGTDYFTDIAFFPQTEGMEGISYCSMRTEIADKKDLKTEEMLPFCGKLSAVNSELFFGGYGLELPEGELPFRKLIFSVTVPMIEAIRGKRMTDTLDTTLTMIHGVLSGTLDEVDPVE
ncbi:MAG: hypothetical protein K6G83_05130 [Lachnospiraceae bacterium]|nr:hypothetical protein [Lachnospiraceae bacterium]